MFAITVKKLLFVRYCSNDRTAFTKHDVFPSFNVPNLMLAVANSCGTPEDDTFARKRKERYP